MDFVTTKENLLRELEVMQGIVEKKSTIPILSNIVIDAQKDRLELLATDLEVGLRGTCEAKPSENTFELRGGEKKDVDSGGDTVCWCSRPASEGPINERRDCATWERVPTGTEVHVK